MGCRHRLQVFLYSPLNAYDPCLHLCQILSGRTQKRTQNAMTLMPFLTLLPLKSLEIQAEWGGVVALSRR